MKRHGITFLFLILAITFYILGATGPATILLAFGVLAEAAFWIRVFGPDRREKRR